jgi:hypothetical protein
LQIAAGIGEEGDAMRELSEMLVSVDESGRDAWRSGARKVGR